MEERLRILKMVEEGKITAEEAARLLEALKGRNVEAELGNLGTFITKIVSRELKRIPEILEDSIRMGFHFEGEFEKREKDVELLKIKNFSGDVSIKGWEEEELVVKGTGVFSARREDKKLIIKQMTGDTFIKSPKNLRIEVENFSGEVEIENFEGNIRVKNMAGDLNVERVKGEVGAELMAGDARMKEFEGKITLRLRAGDAEIQAIQLEGSIKADAGDVVLSVSPDASCIIEPLVEEGDIETEFEMKNEKIIIGEGKRSLKVFAKKGNIIIKRRQE